MTSTDNSLIGEPMDELVLVVHGVGDPAPGATISLLARSTASASRPMIETNEVLWLHEDSDRGRFATAFPVHVRSSETGSYRTVFAEVFWGDLSQVRRGIFGLIRGTLELVFGLRYVAFVAADQPGRAAWLLQWLGVVSARALHGPLLAVNLMLALIMLAIAGTELLWPESCDKAAWSSFVVMLVSLFAFVSAYTIWRISTQRNQERFWFWVMTTAVYLVVVLVLNHLPTLGGNVSTLEDVPGIFQATDVDPREHHATSLAAAADARVGVDPTRQLNWYARLLIVTMGMLWLSLMLMLIAMAVTWFIARLNPRANRRGLDVAMLLPMLAIGGWGQVLPIIWLMGEDALSKVAQIEQFDNLFEEAVPLLGIQCMMCALMGLVQILVFIYYAIWRPRNDVENYVEGTKPPRLIVNFWVQITTAVCACIAISLILALGRIEYAAVGSQRSLLWTVIKDANNYAITILIPLAGLFLIAFRYLGSALDIVLDVVNHFYFRRTSESSQGMKCEVEFDESDITFDSGRLYYSKRAMIHSRMIQVLDHFRIKSAGKRPVLTVLSHSQGTVVAIEVLNSPKLDWLRSAFSEIRLVTMGSPFTHIYQHYFSHNYPPLDQPYWSQLRQRVDYWYNIFRVDDFVGTEIHFPPSLGRSGGFSCLNFPIKRFGHNNYWSDKQVIELLRTQAEFAWVADKPMATAPVAAPLQSEGKLRRAG